MQKTKQILLFAALLLVSVIVTACGGGANETNSDSESSASESNEETITLELGHIAPADHGYQLGLEQFVQAVEEESNGKVKIEIYGAGQLGGERDMSEQVQLGTLDMALMTTGPLGNFVPNLAVLEMPFLFEDVDHAYRVLDGEIGEELLKELEESGFKGFAYWENGIRGISNSKHEIRTPEDMAGLKMRTLENDVFVETFRALGSDPTPIAWPETYTSLQQGVADGFDSPYAQFGTAKMYEVQDYYTEAGIYYASAILMMNMDKYNGLPADVQELLERLGKEFAPIQRDINKQLADENKQLILDNGVEIVEVDEVDTEAFRAAVQPVYERFADQFGDYVERIQALK
ncbi:TRAP transporter substrate-binding protein DctP [Anaerobacillus sp. MEB173]|uniref:TRAP transporter substrate-binding protein DctP n=1 Tax=Anaerobacillus sp. MEB173 TaxID=3383345 RepID=UPI003F8DA779